MRSARYVGANKKYKDQTALVRKGLKRHTILVQFDNMNDFFEKGHGWHEFLQKDWEYRRCIYCGEYDKHDLDCPIGKEKYNEKTR